MTFRILFLFLAVLWFALKGRVVSSSNTSSPPPTSVYQLCQELRTNSNYQLQGIFPSGNQLYIIYREQVFTVPFNPSTVHSSLPGGGKLILEGGSHLGPLSDQPWAKNLVIAANSSLNTTLKNVYLLFTPTGRAEVNALIEEKKGKDKRLVTWTYDFESGQPTRSVSAANETAGNEVYSEYVILTDGDQHTYVLTESDPKYVTTLLLIPHITRKSGNLTLPLKALHEREPLQQQYRMNQSNEHFISFHLKEVGGVTELKLVLSRFPKFFPSVGFLVKWGNSGRNKTMHLFEQQFRKVHILGDPGDALLQQDHHDVPLFGSVRYSDYFICRSFFDQVLAVCTSPYGLLLLGLALIQLCALVYACCGKVQKQKKVLRSKAASKSGALAKADDKSTTIELQIASSALGSSESSSVVSSSTSACKTTSASAGKQEKAVGKRRKA